MSLAKTGKIWNQRPQLKVAPKIQFSITIGIYLQKHPQPNILVKPLMNLNTNNNFIKCKIQ